MYPEFVVPSKPATGSGYLTSDSRIARYEQHLDRLQENGYQNTEKLGEYSGRINMLKEGYVLAGDGKLVGNKLNPGYGKGTQGIDRIYSNVNDSYDFAILESKYRTIFTDGENPLTLLPQTKKSGQQMSTPWIMNNINKMTGPNQGVRLNNIGDDLLLNGYNNRYLNVLNGSGQRFMFNLDDYGLK